MCDSLGGRAHGRAKTTRGGFLGILGSKIQGQGASLARGSQAPAQALKLQSPQTCRDKEGIPGATELPVQQ